MGGSSVLSLEYTDIDGETVAIIFFGNELDDLIDVIDRFKDQFTEKEKEELGF
jgi:hypothetical protein